MKVKTMYSLLDYCELFHQGNRSSLARALKRSPQQLANMEKAVKPYYVAHVGNDWVVYQETLRGEL